jgi:3-deoxy-manno-octulosonate cytidylyltransferase (CMP-KDO synthetase)
MIEHVVDACQQTEHRVCVVTDDIRIHKKVMNKCMSFFDPSEHPNGTARVASKIKDAWLKKYDNIVNVQGDMPDVTPEMIEKCIAQLEHYPVTTVFTEMPKEKQDDPNTVKMIRAGDQALWFGRGMTGYGDWHLGVYGYRRNALKMYSTLEVTPEEEIEQLEQLRWLKNGWQIGCLSVQYKGTEINTQEDVTEWHNKNSQ